MASTRPDIQVTAVVFDGFALLDLAGPADVFRAASLLGERFRYRLVVASSAASPSGRAAE